MKPSKNILLVEDDRQMRDYLGTVLRLSGHSVVCCNNGEVAVELETGKPFQVVISDYHMPGMNGAEAVRILKKRYPEALVIGYSGRMVERKFLEAGADLFLLKPFQVKELLDMVQMSEEG
jgi:CheY-like chemotaxis protein